MQTPRRSVKMRRAAGVGRVLGRLLAITAAAIAQRCGAEALTPEQALARFKTAEGFRVELFASEPLVRQPVSMTFDDRGRLWVIQYLQYPTPAGLKPVEVDRYLRTKYDRVPAPPPHGPRGADKITILEDTDGDGRADTSHDFVTGLNLASALALGDGGVYVGQAPYLLFYPDRDRDDRPDGDPQVLLRGFGMEDAHAVINSLQFGPDGWLYGAQGSTVTADVRGIGFQQGIWRYHPPSKRFELFAEGGGNTWGLDFDRTGQAIAGTNWGDAVCLHHVQGGYYVKGFSKHGPLHNPYSYGYFEHVVHQGHVGGHVTCGGIVYQGDAFPAEFSGAYVAANLLSNAVYYSALEPHGSTFKSRFVGTLLETDDVWFRPIDCLTGPDGSLFVADWYDERANHVIPDDTWDRSNGRIWKIVYQGPRPSQPAGPPQPAASRQFDLAQRSGEELVRLLAHANNWQRRQARRILAERRDATLHPRLRVLVDGDDAQTALEALWALDTSGGWNDELALRLLDHDSHQVRAWAVRRAGDDARPLPRTLHQRLVRLAGEETSPVVRSQLAATCKRLPGDDALDILAALWLRADDQHDPDIPLLLWWAVEDKAVSHREAVLSRLADTTAWRAPLVRETIVARLARRYLAERTAAGYQACARLVAMAPAAEDVRRLVTAMDQDFDGPLLAEVPLPLQATVARLLDEFPADVHALRLAVRLGSPGALRTALVRVIDAQRPAAERLPLVAVLGQSGSTEARERLVSLLDSQGSDAEPLRLASLSALAHFDDPRLSNEVLGRYASFPRSSQDRALAILSGRLAWSQALVQSVSTGQIDPRQVSVEQVRQMLAHGEPSLTRAVEAQWGQVRPATPGEKMAYVPVLGRVLNAGRGDLQRGRALFVKHCATCHTLFGEGNKVGPDLTTADRKNRESLLINILDPSGTIRPEFVAHLVSLTDGRVLTGLVVESDAQRITLVDAKNQRTTLGRDEIEQLEPASQSLMPERLLETLAPQEVRDLFGYLQSEGPAGQPAGR